MQPLAAKLPLSHRTPFSVEDILDPSKFTRRRTAAGERSHACPGSVGSVGDLLLRFIQLVYIYFLMSIF